MIEWYVANSKQENFWGQSNGFCNPSPEIMNGQKVSCLVFTYEGMADGGRSLMGAVALKGIVAGNAVGKYGDCYAIKMAYCAKEDDPELVVKRHVKAMTDKEYDSTKSVVTLTCQNIF